MHRLHISIIRSGQTIVESLVAITIIVVGVTSMLALLTSVTRAGSVSRDEVIAMQLAREAVESVYAVRNSNWLQYKNDSSITYWQGLRDEDDYSGTVSLNLSEGGTDEFITLDFSNEESEPDARVYTDDNGYFRQGDNPGDWVATPYQRTITLNPICFSMETGNEYVVGDGEYCQPTDTEIGIELTSNVFWTSAEGADSDRKIMTRLYDWRYADNEEITNKAFQ